MNPPTDYRMFEYDKRLIPNKWIRQNEGTPAIGLSPGYPAWGLMYYAVMAHMQVDKYNTILEIGTNYGASTIILAQALIDSGRRGRVITIEKDGLAAAAAFDNFKDAGVFDYTEQVICSSNDYWLSHYPTIDIAFIDGSHDCQDVVDDFDNILRHLNIGGLVIFDNTTMGGVHDALKAIKVKHGGNFVEFPCCSWSPAGIVFWER